MTILFLTTHLNTGGITSYLLSLSSALTRKGHKVIVASAGGNCEDQLQEMGVKHFNLGFRTKSEADLRIYLKLPSLCQLVSQENVDVIHAHTRVTQVMGSFLSAMAQKPLVTTCHGFFKPRWFRKTFPCWGKAVIAISKPVYGHLNKDFEVPESRIHLIFNGIDCDKFLAVNNEVKEAKRKQWKVHSKWVIGTIARLSDVKGIDILLKTMPLVIEQVPDVLLLIVGDGPEKEKLQVLVENLNLRNHVHFESIVNQTSQMLPVFDIFVMPSRQEGLGLSVMEAQACGIPVIASRVGGLIDLIEEGKTGYLVAPEHPKELAKKILYVLKEYDKAKQVGLEARDNICRKFSLEQMANATLKVYEQYLSH
jgi:glycosyltransferase involved in cell wall biosynthesis